jgi:CRP-like cAMP-binding protein
MAEQTYQAGALIVQEGDTGSSAYLLKSGTVEVSKTVENTRIVLAVLEPGQVFGEMSLLDEQPRSATVTTLETCVVEEVGQEEAEEIIEGASPLLRSMLTVLVDRIRGMDEWALSSGVNLAQTPITSVTLPGPAKRPKQPWEAVRSS